MAVPARILLLLIFLGVTVLLVVILGTNPIGPQEYRVFDIPRNGHDDRCKFILVFQRNPASEAATVIHVSSGKRPSMGDDIEGNLRGFGKDRQVLNASTNQHFIAEPVYHSESYDRAEAVLSRDPCYQLPWPG